VQEDKSKKTIIRKNIPEEGREQYTIEREFIGIMPR
jgi:hypothetical protein